MGVNAYNFYKPRTDIEYSFKANEKMYVTGSVSTTPAVGYSQAAVHGHTSTHYKTASYQVEINYIGPVNIGNRMIRNVQIPAYENNKSIHDKAIEKADFTCCAPDSCGILGLGCLSTIVCGCCCVSCWNDSRLEKLQGIIDELSDEAMGKHIAQLLEEADKEVDSRIAYIQQQQQQQSQQAALLFANPGLLMQFLQAQTQQGVVLNQSSNEPIPESAIPQPKPAFT